MPLRMDVDFEDDGASFRVRRASQLRTRYPVVRAPAVRWIFWAPAIAIALAAVAFVGILIATGIAMWLTPT